MLNFIFAVVVIGGILWMFLSEKDSYCKANGCENEPEIGGGWCVNCGRDYSHQWKKP